MLRSDIAAVRHHFRVAHYSGLLQVSRLLASGSAQPDEVVLQLQSQSGWLSPSGAGRVRIETLEPGLMRAAYSGVIGERCFTDLRQRVIRATEDARVIVLDMTAVLSTSVIVPPIPTSVYRRNHAPGVVICRKDQLRVWRQYALDISEIGITRIVFSDERKLQALAAARVLLGQ